MEAMNFLSPTGACHSFGADADGYARGEAIASIVLKAAGDLDTKDEAVAVVKGTGVAHDGATMGITLPNASAQAKLIQEVYMEAGALPVLTQFVECHVSGNVRDLFNGAETHFVKGYGYKSG